VQVVAVPVEIGRAGEYCEVVCFYRFSSLLSG